MPNPHPAAVDEIDDLRRLAESQLVGRQHAVALGQCGDVAFPAEFGTGTEFAAVQQHHRVALAGLQVAGGQTVDEHGLAFEVHHLIAIGFTGEPTAPTTLRGGATSWNS